MDEVAQAKFATLEKRLEAVEKGTTKAQEKMTLRLDGVESRVADVTAAVGSLSASVGDQLRASLEQFSKTVEGRFKDFTAAQVEQQKQFEKDRCQQMQDLQDMLAHKSPKVRAVTPKEPRRCIHAPLRVGVANPTQLLGKAEAVSGWQVDLAAFSETSHTHRAVSALRREFKTIGHRLALGRPVDDKFPVRSSEGSFRGKSSGVVVSSVLPVYSFEDERVSSCIWASSRLVHAIVQVGHTPLHVIVAYLHPCAHIGSPKHGGQYPYSCGSGIYC